MSEPSLRSLLEQILARQEMIQAEVERIHRVLLVLLEERAVATGKLSAFFTPEKNRSDDRGNYCMIPDV